MWINFRISSEWIQVLDTFMYHFDHIISKEELDNVSDDEIMDLFINSIWYKTNIENNRRLCVFYFEKRYIKSVLSYFSDKIDYSLLRKILSNN